MHQLTTKRQQIEDNQKIEEIYPGFTKEQRMLIAKEILRQHDNLDLN